METTTLVQRLATQKDALRAKGVEHLAMFGSRARGDFHAASDLDVLLDVRPGAGFSLLDLVEIEQTLTQATGIETNAFMLRSLDAAFKSAIDRDVVTVF